MERFLIGQGLVCFPAGYSVGNPAIATSCFLRATDDLQPSKIMHILKHRLGPRTQGMAQAHLVIPLDRGSHK